MANKESHRCMPGYGVRHNCSYCNPNLLHPSDRVLILPSRYFPSVLTLKPGQFIHINKGRLHAFRKMQLAQIPKDDCHYELCQRYLENLDDFATDLCVSIAWDWMFRGYSPHGLNKEMLAALEALILNRKHGRVSLGIPELCLYRMAQVYAPLLPTWHTTCLFQIPGKLPKEYLDTASAMKNSVCRGILPSLHYVVRRDEETVRNARRYIETLNSPGKRISIAERPNTLEDPDQFAMDPRGNCDFNCKLCSAKLANLYYHCDGCEKLLSKDFNICSKCHAGEKYVQLIQMHPRNNKRHADINHTGTTKTILAKTNDGI